MPVDPDGYDATSAATAAKRKAAEKDRIALLLASQRGMSALELEPDNYDYDSVFDAADENMDEYDDDNETLSLMRETAGFDGGMSRRSSLPSRANRKTPSSSNSASALRRFCNANSSTLRNVVLIAGLAIVTFLFVDNEDIVLFATNNSGNDIDESAGYRYHAHDTAFGGIYNMGHPAGAKAAEGGHFDDEVINVPISSVSHAVQSITVENVLNLQGHYIHDEHRSPYASHLYDRPQAELDAEQERFLAKMSCGVWTFSRLATKRSRPPRALRS